MLGTDKTFNKLIRKYKLMQVHNSLIKSGEYNEAKLIMRLLIDGKICIGLSDAEYTVGLLTEKIGCHRSYGRNYYITIYA